MLLIYSTILFFLLLSALFSGTEIAYISASKLWIELTRKKKGMRARILSHFYDKPGDFLSTMLVGNNIALVIFTILVSNQLEPFMQGVTGIESEPLILLINTLIITIIILIFGEFLPKTLFRLFANELIYFLAIPLRFFQYILWLPSYVMNKLTGFLLRTLFKTPVENETPVITRLDLENFITSSQSDSEEEIDTDLFKNALNLENVKVRECMIPRTEIEHIDVSSSVEELIQLFKDTNLSRLIIIDDDIDEVLGYIHHQQLLTQPKRIKPLILEVPFVPEAMRVRDLLNKFIKERINMACVVDEYGGTSGIITLEDILEEIFGEIEDEHDQEEYIENQISDYEFVFSGRLELDYLNEKYETLDFPEGEYHTLSGYIVMTTETIPKQGQVIELDGYEFRLVLVSDTKIETVRVIKKQLEDEAMAE